MKKYYLPFLAPFLYLFILFIDAQNIFCEQSFEKGQEINKKQLEVSRSCALNEEQVNQSQNKLSNNIEEVRNRIESGFFDNSKEILDIGCGDGNLTAIFAANLPHASILGCDVSKTMIEHALQQHVAFNLNFLEMSAENLNFEKKFDTVISFNCLHWIGNQKRAINQIFNVLKPGGKALLVATPSSSNNDFKTICRRLILSFRWAPYFLTFRSVHSFHTKQEYEKLLNNAGFFIDKIEIKQIEKVLKNRDELDLFLKEVLTPLKHLDPRNQPAFLEDFFKELNRRGRVDVNGVIHIFFDQIEIIVSKNTY